MQIPVQTAPLAIHWPLVLQVCGVLLEQREVPGVHTPLQEPPLQR
jgi:hypothetical protein